MYETAAMFPSHVSRFYGSKAESRTIGSTTKQNWTLIWLNMHWRW